MKKIILLVSVFVSSLIYSQNLDFGTKLNGIYEFYLEDGNIIKCTKNIEINYNLGKVDTNFIEGNELPNTKYLYNILTDKHSFTINNVIPGQTITEGLASIAVPVVTSSALQYTGGPPGLFAKPVMTDGTAGSGPQVSIADVDAIFADRVYNENAGGVGFFLIDIANNFQMDFVGENTRSQLSTNGINGKDTMSIVSRYYTSNNFVSDQGSGSIVYTHSGANRNLTQLAVRVKNPDGTFVDDTTLGNKNTVFLKITRAKPIYDGGSTLPSTPPPKE